MDENWIEELLVHDSEQHLVRRMLPFEGCGPYVQLGEQELLNLASNDYLGLSRSPKVVRAGSLAAERYGVSSTASRVVCGTTDLHVELEQQLAAFLGFDAALLFSSGYLANIGLLASCVGRHDTVFIDRLIHASVIDAVKLSGANFVRFAHNDPADLAEQLALDATKSGGTNRRRFVVTESVFSMDGDLAPLDELSRVSSEHGAYLIVDEAHAIGVFGGGKGRCAEEMVSPDVFAITGTLGKSFGSHGGFVCASEQCINLLLNRARSFLFDTALSPFHVAAALASLEDIVTDATRGEALLSDVAQLLTRLSEKVGGVSRSRSQIVPILIGNPEHTVAIAAELRAQNILAAAIRQPTVPVGTDRLRLSFSAGHRREDLERAIDAIIQTVGPYRLNPPEQH